MAGLTTLSLAVPALAQGVEAQLVAGLRAQGYVILEEGRTFFGRLRIVAENDSLHREIVVNPETGEVLRDYAVLLADRAANGKGAAPSSSGSEGSSGGGPGQVATASAADPATALPMPGVAPSTTAVILADPVITLGPVSK